VDLVWKNGFKHGFKLADQNKVAIEIAYIPYIGVFEFL